MSRTASILEDLALAVDAAVARAERQQATYPDMPEAHGRGTEHLKARAAALRHAAQIARDLDPIQPPRQDIEYFGEHEYEGWYVVYRVTGTTGDTWDVVAAKPDEVLAALPDFDEFDEQLPVTIDNVGPDELIAIQWPSDLDEPEPRVLEVVRVVDGSWEDTRTLEAPAAIWAELYQKQAPYALCSSRWVY